MFGPDHLVTVGRIHRKHLKIPIARQHDIQRGIVHATEPYVIYLIRGFLNSGYSQSLQIGRSVQVREFPRSTISKDCLCPMYPGLDILVRQRMHVQFSVIHLLFRGANVKAMS